MNVLPSGIRENWDGEGPLEDTALFLLVVSLFMEGQKDPTKAVMCGVASPDGTKWFDDFEEANVAYEVARNTHDGLAYLACMPGHKADVHLR